jgi:hypothetical protein
MKSLLRTGRITLPVITLLCLLPPEAFSQVISIKTVPVASGDQFVIIPSRNLGMGGISIALDDPLLDPFINPGKGRKIEGAKLFGGSSFYSITQDNGSGRTLPMALLIGSDEWFGGAAGAIQQLIPASPVFSIPWFRAGPIDPWSQTSFRGPLPQNRYGFGMLGKTLPGGKVAIGASVSAADLEAVDGVELLYANSSEIEQYGRTVDYRLGVAGDLEEDRTFEVLLLHSRIRMTHDVTYFNMPGPFVDPPIPSPAPSTMKRNHDYSNTTGIHFGYVQPMEQEGWRVGGILTGNWKSHPKIPEYELEHMTPIPKDPGNSWAYNVGFGFSKKNEASLIGIDFIFEPVWTETWGEAGEPITTDTGLVIPAGGKTVENDFRFDNYIFCMGTQWERGSTRFQLGLQLRSVNYRLNQLNNVEGSKRLQREHWIEWTPSWGIALNLPEFGLHYVGRMRAGTGRPGAEAEWFGGWRGQMGDSVLAMGSDFLVAPTGSLVLQDATVVTHQFFMVIPLRF